jgi:MFS family permease
MNRNLVIVSFSLVTWGVGEGMFLFFQPLYLQELGASPLEIGGILGLVGIAMITAHIPAGYLADRVGRRPLLVFAWIIGGVATWMMALAQKLPVFIAGSALYAMTSFVVSPLNSYITAARGNLSVGRAISLVSASFNAGAIVGPLLGGWIGNKYGLHVNYFVGAWIFILSSILICFISPQPKDHPHQSPPVASPHHQPSRFNHRFINYLGLIFLATFCMYLPQPLSQNFLLNQRSVSLIQIGWLISCRSLGVVLFNLVIGHLNPRKGYLISQALVAGFTVFLWLGTGFPWYMLGYFLMGSYMTARTMASAQGRALVESSRMGLAYGTIETVSALAVILAPPIAGLLYNINPPLVYPVSLGLIMVALLCTAILLPQHPEFL